jgi:hypothetical protein
MAPRQLDKADWRGFFDQVSKILIGKRVEIELASLALGDQIEAEWLPLLGITYDPKDDIIEIALDGLDHLIHRPQKVYIDGTPTALAALEVVEGEGIQQIIKFRDPLTLPPPRESRGEARPGIR